MPLLLFWESPSRFLRLSFPVHYVSSRSDARLVFRVGDLRMRSPVANEPYSGEYNATAFGAPCIFQNITDVSRSSIDSAAADTWDAYVGVAAAILVGDSEDCAYTRMNLYLALLKAHIIRSDRQRLDA